MLVVIESTSPRSHGREGGDRSQVPDWSYRTLLRPTLFTLSPERARDLTLGTMATLATLPGGALLIETFGDLAPPPALSTMLAGVSVRSPIGMGVGIDTTGRAARAWESLGVGFIEIGPITERPVPSPAPIVRNLQAMGSLPLTCPSTLVSMPCVRL